MRVRGRLGARALGCACSRVASAPLEIKPQRRSPRLTVLVDVQVDRKLTGIDSNAYSALFADSSTSPK